MFKLRDEIATCDLSSFDVFVARYVTGMPNLPQRRSLTDTATILDLRLISLQYTPGQVVDLRSEVWYFLC